MTKWAILQRSCEKKVGRKGAALNMSRKSSTRGEHAVCLPRLV